MSFTSFYFYFLLHVFHIQCVSRWSLGSWDGPVCSHCRYCILVLSDLAGAQHRLSTARAPPPPGSPIAPQLSTLQAALSKQEIIRLQHSQLTMEAGGFAVVVLCLCACVCVRMHAYLICVFWGLARGSESAPLHLTSSTHNAGVRPTSCLWKA